MAIDFLERCDAIEECYEFMLAYASQGLPSDTSSGEGGTKSQIRVFLDRAAQALTGLANSCATAMKHPQSEPVGARSFIGIIDRDARDSLAAIELVLAQPTIGSQLIDNLNASIHLRALLTDLFLVGEIVRSRSKETTLPGRENG
jgi:hypothetical protein